MPSVTQSRHRVCSRAALGNRYRSSRRAVVRGEAPDRFGELDRATGGEMSRALDHEGIWGEALRHVHHAGGRSGVEGQARGAALAPDAKARSTSSLARKLATAVALVARQRRVESLAFVMRPGLPDPSGDVDVAGYLQAIAEGLTLAEFDGASYKTGESALGASAASHDRRHGGAPIPLRRACLAWRWRSRAGACWANAAISRVSWRTSRAIR